MALSDLQTALANLDAAIVEVSSTMASPSSYSVPGLSAQRARLRELTEARKALLDAIAQEERNQDPNAGIAYVEFDEPEER